jgi:hypothetical protein
VFKDEYVNSWKIAEGFKITQLSCFFRFFTTFFLLFLATTHLEAIEYSCKFKDVLNYRDNVFYTTCELHNVKLNDKSTFELSINLPSLNTSTQVPPTIELAPTDPENTTIPTISESDREEAEEALRDSIKRVAFQSSKLSNIPNEIFIKFTQLEVFDASNTNLNYFNTLSFNKAENLLEIYLNSNSLKTFKGFVFVHSKKLQILDLSSNYIEKLPVFAFNGLENLQSLDLSHNRIEELDVSDLAVARSQPSQGDSIAVVHRSQRETRENLRKFQQHQRHFSLRLRQARAASLFVPEWQRLRQQNLREPRNC